MKKVYNRKIDNDNNKEVSKIIDLSGGRPEGSLFNSYYTEV